MEKDVLYCKLGEVDGSQLEIRRLDGTYHLCLTKGEESKTLAIRSMTAMDLMRAAGSAGLRKR